MVRVLPITPAFAISAAPGADDYASIAALGYSTIISFVPEGENSSVLAAAEAAQAAARHGLKFVHVPAAKYDLFTDGVVSAAQGVLATADGPVLGTCVSGQRAAIVWAAAMARSMPVDDILKVTAKAGLNLSVLRDDLETQAQRALLARDFHWAA